MEKKNEKLLCSSCHKQFLNIYNLRRHIKNFHSNICAPALKRKNKDHFKYNCDQCERHFNNIHPFNYHKRKYHNIETTSAKVVTERKCPLCDFKNMSKKNMINHFENRHDLKILNKAMDFLSIHEFEEWKISFEAETTSHFVMEKTEKTKRSKTIKYICHRSGSYLPKGNGLRRLKTQGSQKINGFCPASINLTIDQEEKCRAIVTETHVGHQNEVQHLHLSLQERKILAKKLASKIPFDTILDSVRNAVEGTALKRIHLLTRKDLHNIKAELNLCSQIVEHSNDASTSTHGENEKNPDPDFIITSKVEKSSHCQNPLNELNEESSQPKESFEREKQEVLDILNKLSATVQNAKSLTHLRVIKRMLAPFSPTLTVVKTEANFVTQNSGPPNKRIKADFHTEPVT